MNHLDPLARRRFLAETAKSCFGLSIGGSMASMFSQRAFAESNHIQAEGAVASGKAKHVIYFMMSGGMSHLDTFDPKPDAAAEIRGNTTSVNGKAPGIQLGHCLPKLAAMSDKISLIRNMSSTQGAHSQGQYFMRTGYTPRASITHPSTGGWVNYFTHNPEKTIPGFISIHSGNEHPGSGFLPPHLSPLPIGNASEGLPNTSLARGVREKQFQKRMNIRQMLDQEFGDKFAKGQSNVRAYDAMYSSALKLMKSEDLKAFDLSLESKATHKIYGDSNFGKGALLARRLIEHGVKFIDVKLGGFDWHGDFSEQMESQVPVIDEVISGLLYDLEHRGLLDSTLVVVATEFGRSPKINSNQGRNHFPKAFSAMMAGGGMKGGFVLGETDATGENIVGDKVDATNINATIGMAMGLPYDKTIYSPSKRPFSMGTRSGKPILELFS